ncbi:DUF6541 family protein [Corynebacterium atypicum]
MAATTASASELALLAVLSLLALVIPGATVTFAFTRRPGLSLAASVPTTIGILGLFSWVYGAQEIPVTVASLTAGCVVTLIVALALGSVAARASNATGNFRRGPANEAARDADAPRPGREAENSPAAASGSSSPVSSSRVPPGHLQAPAGLSMPWLAPLASAASVAAITIWATIYCCQIMIRLGDRGLRSIPQGWDMHWHASLVHWVHTAGIISPTHTGELRYAEDHMLVYYPTGWHTACDFATSIAWRLTGREWDDVEAINLFMALSITLAAAGSAAALTWVVSRRAVRHTGVAAGALRWAAVTTAALAGALLPAWQIIFFDGSWPVGFGLGLGGIAAAVTIQAVTSQRRAWVASIAAALSILGAVQTHASTATLLAAALGLWFIQQLVRPTPGTTRMRIVFHLTLAAVLTAAPFYPQFRVGLGNVSEVAETVGQETDTLSGAWSRAIFMQTKFFDFYEDRTFWYALVVLGLVGLLVACARGGAWLAGLAVVAIVGTAHSLHRFDGVFGQLVGAFTSLNYNAPHRIALIAAMAVASGVGLLALYLVFIPLARGAGRLAAATINDAPTTRSTAAHDEALTREPRPSAQRPRATDARPHRRVGAAAGASVIAASVVLSALWAPPTVRAEKPALEILLAADKTGRMVSAADMGALDWLRDRMLESNAPFSILSVPEAGMSWGYITHDLPMVYTHYLADRYQDQLDTNTVLYEADQISGDPNARVDAAACRTGIRYLIDSKAMFWGLPPYPSFENLQNAPGLTEVYSDGEEVRIFEVDSWDPYRCTSVR